MASIDRLLEIMARLRDPDGGCPWDAEQTFESIAPYTIEEAYEVAHAIERGDLEDLRDELGDLLLQVVYHAQMAREQQAFTFDEVVEAICEKLVRRHPHVFGDAEAGGSERLWEKLKAQERAEKQARARDDGEAHDPFGDIPRAQPALMRARKLVSRAHSEAGHVPLDARDEAASAAVDAFLAQAPSTGAGGAASADSRLLGTLLQACVRAAQTRGLDPEELLRERNRELERRVRAALATAGNHVTSDD
jgi:ATP diphosphatase